MRMKMRMSMYMVEEENGRQVMQRGNGYDV